MQENSPLYVVTGGAGFIGSNLIAEIEARQLGDVVVCDCLGSGDKWRNLSKRTLSDIITPNRLEDFLKTEVDRIETVFHLGAISATTATDGDLVIHNNFTFSKMLWDWCARHQRRFVYASSAATYGDGSLGFDDDNSLFALKRLRPLNLYGWSKHLFDLRAAQAIKNGEPHPRQWVGLKFFNVFGPNEYHKGDMMSVVAKVYQDVVEGQTARLFKSHREGYADGGQVRDFVWVDDVVDCMLWLNDNPKVNGLFNLGSGRARSFADLATAVFSVLGVPARIEYVDMPEAIRPKYQYFTQANMDSLAAAGYELLRTPLETAVESYVRGFLAAPDPYR